MPLWLNSKEVKHLGRLTLVHHCWIYEQVANQIINQRDFLIVGHKERLESRVNDYLDCHYWSALELLDTNLTILGYLLCLNIHINSKLEQFKTT